MKSKKMTVAGMLVPLMAGAALALPAVASAEARTARNDWVNSSVVVWKNPFGQCWQGRHWMPAMRGEDCAAEAPARQPAVLLVQQTSERPALALNAAAEETRDILTQSFDTSMPSDPGSSMITSCFTTHN
jgi:hypothetical protein